MLSSMLPPLHRVLRGHGRTLVLRVLLSTSSRAVPPPAGTTSSAVAPSTVEVVTPKRIKAAHWHASVVKSPVSNKLVPHVTWSVPEGKEESVLDPPAPEAPTTWRQRLMILGLCLLTSAQLGAVLTWSNDAGRVVGDEAEWMLHMDQVRSVACCFFSSFCPGACRPHIPPALR